MIDPDYEPSFPQTFEEQDKLGYCIRCLAPKSYETDPDLCAACDREIDEFLKKTKKEGG